MKVLVLVNDYPTNTEKYRLEEMGMLSMLNRLEGTEFTMQDLYGAFSNPNKEVDELFNKVIEKGYATIR